MPEGGDVCGEFWPKAAGLLWEALAVKADAQRLPNPVDEWQELRGWVKLTNDPNFIFAEQFRPLDPN